VKNPIDYFGAFPEQPEKKRYGEASHLYFSAPEAAPVLAQLFPKAKFVLIFRNPVERAHSLYQHMRRGAYEPLETFELALSEEEKRFRDPAFPKVCDQYFWNYMYVRSSLFDEQFARFRAYFPREQFFLLTLGEWKCDPAFWAREIFRFLEIDEGVSVNPEPQNRGGRYPALDPETRGWLTRRFDGVKERLEAHAGRALTEWES
jgi:hypothetical protein